MKKIGINLLVVVAIVAAGYGIAKFGIGIRSRPAGAEIVHEKKPLNVKIQVLEARMIEDELKLMGTFEAWQDLTLSAINQGVIGMQAIEEGDLVESDQELMRIDSGELVVALAQMKAQHDLAVSELKRVQELQDEGISSPQAMDRAKTDFQVAYVKLRAAEIKIEDGLLIAKFTGVIDTIYQEEGEFVSVGAPMVRLVQLDRLKLIVGIPERDVAHFAIGDAVIVRLDAYPEDTFAGSIYRIAATAEESTHTFKTEIELDNALGKLKPGMIARALLVRESFPNSIMIPLFSLISTDAGRHAFIDDNGEARQRNIEIGFLQGTEVFVREGLRGGERLIVVGHRDLRDGDKIAVREVIR